MNQLIIACIVLTLIAQGAWAEGQTASNGQEKVLENIPSYSQDSTDWCSWVSAQMVLNYYGYSVSPQAVAVKTFELAGQKWGGKDKDELPWRYYKFYEDAIRSLSNNHLAIDEINAQNKDDVLYKIFEAIDHGYPIILLSGGPWLYDATDLPELSSIIDVSPESSWPSGDHASVIVGYSLKEEMNNFITSGPLTFFTNLLDYPPVIKIQDPATAATGVGIYWVSYGKLFEKTIGYPSVTRLIIVKPNPEAAAPASAQMNAQNPSQLVSSTVNTQSTSSTSQAPAIQWTKIFEIGSSSSSANSVQQTSDGGYIIAGLYNLNASLIKTDTLGNEVWNKIYCRQNKVTEARSVRQTNDKGYIIAGDCGLAAWLIKTDASGNEVWNKTFGGSKEDRAFSVQQMSDGGYIIAGDTESYGEKHTATWLIKTDASGNEVWNKTLGAGSLSSVRQTSDGGYITAGSVLIKTDSSGNTAWNKTFSGAFANSVQQTSDGGFILAGNNGNKEAWLIKTDVSGNEVWNKNFEHIGNSIANSVQQTSDGGFILAGYTYYFPSGTDAWMIKTDAVGNEVWNEFFSSTKVGSLRAVESNLNSVQQTSDGGYIAAGSAQNYPPGVWLIKTDADENTAHTLSSTVKPRADTQGQVTNKASGFGGILAVAALLCVFILRRKD